MSAARPASCYAELEAERDGPRQWKVSGIVGISPNALYADQAEADAELATVLVAAFRQAQALSR